MNTAIVDSKRTAGSSLIVSPEDVVEWLARPSDLGRILADVACRIGNQMRCDACSIYRLDRRRGTLILAATVGLRRSCVETLQMNVTEGLCGLVTQTRGPVSVASDAASHPRFKHFPEAGEEPYETFLGVPIVDGAQIVGVLVVQTIAQHEFSDNHLQLLALTGRQIGPLVTRLTHDREAV